MLGIKIRGTFLSLYDNVALTFEVVHPMGIVTDAKEIIRGSYSFPIDVPLDDVNRGIIGHVDRLDQGVHPVFGQVMLADEYCEVWAEGLLLYIGKATLKKANNDRASLFIILNVLKELEGVSMTTLDLGGDRAIGADETTRTNHAQDTVENPLDHDYVFAPVLNTECQPAVWGQQFENAQQRHWQNFYSSDDDHFAEYVVTTISPFIRLDYLLARIFAHEGYSLDNQWQNTDELKLILLYNNYNINTHAAPGVSSWDESINLQNHVPHRNSLDLVLSVIGTFALGVFADPHDRKISLIPLDTLINGPVTSDWTSRAAVGYEHNSDKDFFGTWRFGLDENDNLSVEYGVEPFPQNLVLGSGLTIQDIYAAEHWGIRYALADNTYYDVQEDSGSMYYAQDHRPRIIDPAKKVYTSELIPLWNSWDLKTDGTLHPDIDLGVDPWSIDGIQFQEIMVAHIRHKGFIKPYLDTQTLCTTFRMMLYRGMQPCIADLPGFETYEYPMAHITEYNINGDIIGDHSLLWHGERGIYQKYWNSVYNMMNNALEVNRRMNLSIRDLINFRFYHKIRIENQNYFITRLRFTLTHRGLSVTEATMITTL